MHYDFCVNNCVKLTLIAKHALSDEIHNNNIQNT